MAKDIKVGKRVRPEYTRQASRRAVDDRLREMNEDEAEALAWLEWEQEEYYDGVGEFFDGEDWYPAKDKYRPREHRF